mmetsp:Transcript_15949/g.37796  ORF Transcript_15949/g.37796 Transcript_15949/m.37796 type:complete len:247 (-) Transcript_15949:858-1598(-)
MTSSSLAPSKSSRARTSMSIAEGVMDFMREEKASKSPFSTAVWSTLPNSAGEVPEPRPLESAEAPSAGCSGTSKTGCRPIEADETVGRKNGAASGFFGGSTGLFRSLMISRTASDSHWLFGRSDTVTSSGWDTPETILPSASRSSGSSANKVPPPSPPSCLGPSSSSSSSLAPSSSPSSRRPTVAFSTLACSGVSSLSATAAEPAPRKIWLLLQRKMPCCSGCDVASISISGLREKDATGAPMSRT